MRFPWQGPVLNEVEQEARSIEQSEKKTEQHYHRVANLAIWTIAVGAVLSTSSDVVDKIAAGHATPAEMGSLLGYLIAVIVGNTMMFGAAKKIQYAIEIGKKPSLTDQQIIGLVMSVECLSFLFFLWNFEHLAFDGGHLVKILISTGRALILSVGAVYLELYLSAGVSPARIRAMAQKTMGLGTLVDLYKIMRSENIATASKIDMYAASLEDHETPDEQLRSISRAAGELVDSKGRRLLTLPPAKDPYIIDGSAISLASAQKGGTVETDNEIMLLRADKKDSARLSPVKKRGTNNRMPSKAEQKKWDKRREIVVELRAADPQISVYAMVKELKRRGDKQANDHGVNKILDEMAQEIS
jgi:hypothetical protein